MKPAERWTACTVWRALMGLRGGRFDTSWGLFALLWCRRSVSSRYLGWSPATNSSAEIQAAIQKNIRRFRSLERKSGKMPQKCGVRWKSACLCVRDPSIWNRWSEPGDNAGAGNCSSPTNTHTREPSRSPQSFDESCRRGRKIVQVT